MESQKGKGNLERMVGKYLEEVENKRWLMERTRACSGCGVRVEKRLVGLVVFLFFFLCIFVFVYFFFFLRLIEGILVCFALFESQSCSSFYSCPSFLHLLALVLSVLRSSYSIPFDS